MSEYNGITEATSPWSGLTAQANFLSLVNHVLTQGAKASRPTELGGGGIWAKDIGGGDFELYLYDGTTDHKIPYVDGADSGAQARADLGLGFDGGAFAGRLISVQIFDVAGSETYTPTSGTAKALAEVIGAGGSGGYGDGTGAGNVSIGAGGGAGARCQVFFTVDADTYSISIGAGGAGSTSSTNSGGDTTIVSDGDAGAGLDITADGGTGGGTSTTNGAVTRSGGPGGAASAPTGTSVISHKVHDGNSGGGGFGFTAGVWSSVNNMVFGGAGGPSLFGESKGNERASGSANASSAGGDCSGNGGGGSGAVAVGNPGSVAGGDGGDGIVVIYEYSE
ncbi:MAG: hypothetical protein VX874_15930 [Pseudomonadota bacterium]|nr:hypothetical protein [Pseudomonadota bacterium]